MQDKTNPFAFYAGLHLLFAFYANIVKGECRDKRELYFRFDYAEPNPVFVVANIKKRRTPRTEHRTFLRQIGQYLTFIARTTILHRQPFFIRTVSIRKKEKSFLIFFVLLRYGNFDLLIGSQGMVPPMESP